MPVASEDDIKNFELGWKVKLSIVPEAFPFLNRRKMLSPGVVDNKEEEKLKDWVDTELGLNSKDCKVVKLCLNSMKAWLSDWSKEIDPVANIFNVFWGYVFKWYWFSPTNPLSCQKPKLSFSTFKLIYGFLP